MQTERRAEEMNSEVRREFETPRRVHFDWTINLGHILTALAMLTAGILAYADLKADVRELKNKTDLRFEEYNKMWTLQRQVDIDQDQRVIRIYNTWTELLRDMKTDLRADIRSIGEDHRRMAPQKR